MSSRHRRLSKPIDALMRCISSAGPPPNLPPHISCVCFFSVTAWALPRVRAVVKRSEPVVRALVVRLGAGEGIDAIIFRVAAVALHPVPADPVRGFRLDQRLPKLGILDG